MKVDYITIQYTGLSEDIPHNVGFTVSGANANFFTRLELAWEFLVHKEFRFLVRKEYIDDFIKATTDCRNGIDPDIDDIDI